MNLKKLILSSLIKLPQFALLQMIFPLSKIVIILSRLTLESIRCGCVLAIRSLKAIKLILNDNLDEIKKNPLKTK